MGYIVIIMYMRLKKLVLLMGMYQRQAYGEVHTFLHFLTIFRALIWFIMIEGLITNYIVPHR
jgi:hypothetical protein